MSDQTKFTWEWRIPEAMNEAKGSMSKGLRALTLDGAALYQNEMRESPRSGRIYGKHQASAPGEAPAPDTGRLIGSVFGGEIEFQDDLIISRIVANTEYAAHLMIGTEKIAKRRGLQDTIQDNWDTRLMQIFKAYS